MDLNLAVLRGGRVRARLPTLVRDFEVKLKVTLEIGCRKGLLWRGDDDYGDKLNLSTQGGRTEMDWV